MASRGGIAAAIPNLPSVAGLAAIILATAVLYLSRLGAAPVYVAADEAHFAVHASSLAEQGTDANGRAVPVFFEITDPLTTGRTRVWYQPFLFYLLAVNFSFLPVNEFSARLPVALIGVLDVVLIFVAGRRLLRSDAAAMVGAGALALTPAHFLFSRQAVDYICLLPFVLVWLWCVVAFSQTRKTAHWNGAMLALGVGLYTYIASWAVMPLLGLLAALVVRPGRRNLIQGAIAFALPTIVLLSLQPRMFTVLEDIVTRYQLGGASGAIGNPLAAVSRFNLAERASLYWDYFDPSFLFFAGGSDLLMATSRAGVFLLPLAVLMAAGFFTLIRRRAPVDLLLLAGFVIAPLPIVLTMPEAPHSAIGRAMTMVPFGVLIGAAGAQSLWQSTRLGKLAAITLVALLPIQFWSFRIDYLTAYQERSAIRFDPNATRDVVDAVVGLDRQSGVPRILLQDDGDGKGIRWRFYTRVRQRDDLWARTRYFHVDAFDSSVTPVGSLLVMQANDPRAASLAPAGCVKVATIAGVGEFPATDIFRRER